MGEQVWFITGASRGMGVEFARAALRAGHSVVATGRNAAATTRAVGDHDRLLVVGLDVTDQESADGAVQSSIDRFGRIDVLVNNAGNSFKGYFEEMSPAQVEAQLSTNLLGPMNVTRAVLPQMRAQRSGHVISISSGAALVGFEYSSVYAASKAGLEGWMTALRQEIAPFGIHATIVNPGWFRTGLAGPESLVWPDVVIDDYAERSAAAAEVVASTRRSTSRRPAQAGRGSCHARGDGSPTRPVLRRPRRVRHRRTQDRRAAGRHRHPARVVDVADVDEPVPTRHDSGRPHASQHGELVEQRILKAASLDGGCRFVGLLVEPVSAGSCAAGSSLAASQFG